MLQNEFTQLCSCIETQTQKYDTIYTTVKRGDIYWTDFGKPYGHEQGYFRPAIVVQNAVGNAVSNTTIVAPITTNSSHEFPTHYILTEEDQSLSLTPKLFEKLSIPSVILGEQLQSVDKSRLRSYIATMDDDFMKKLDIIISISLGLIEDKFHTSKYVNFTQIDLLCIANPSSLLNISKLNISKEDKLKKIFELFQLDITENGMEYVTAAVLSAPKNEFFNLNDICTIISLDFPSIPIAKIKAKIINTLKKGLHFKNSPAIDFIRLVSAFI